jgi:hypothetical protein
MLPSYLIHITFFTTSLVYSQLLPPKGLNNILARINMPHSQFYQREWFTVRVYSNHMFLLPPSVAVGAAFSWLYLVLCHQTTFYDFLPLLNMYNIPSLLHPYTDASSCMVKYLCISSYIRKPFLIMTLQPIPAEFVSI